MEIEITQPEPEDAAEIASVYAKTWLVTYPNDEHGISVEDIKIRTDQMLEPERVDKLREMIGKSKDDPKQFYCVAKKGVTIVGVCGGVVAELGVEMASLYVLPDEQGMGIGGKLMQAFLNWANQNKRVYLHVVTYNQPAIRFYEQWGFRDSGKRLTEERFRMPSGNIFPEMEMVLEKVSSGGS